MRILVTGATGFIGQHLVHTLIQQGQSVAILLREAYSAGRPLPAELTEFRLQIDIVHADLRNYNLTARALRNTSPEFVVHLAAAGVNDPFLGIESALRHNVNGTINLLRACFEGETAHRRRRMIVARTPGENSATNVYAASKAASWKFCQMFARTQGWSIVGAKIFQAYGQGQPAQALIPSAIRAALSAENFPMTSGGQERDWIYVDDVVKGMISALAADLAPGTTFDLGTGDLNSVADVVRRIYQLVGGDGRPLIGALPDRPGDEVRQAPDLERTRELLGWESEVSLDEGLQRLIHELAN
jgi:nucleoside-diphosphate-sugar epimerase